MDEKVGVGALIIMALKACIDLLRDGFSRDKNDLRENTRALITNTVHLDTLSKKIDDICLDLREVKERVRALEERIFKIEKD